MRAQSGTRSSVHGSIISFFKGTVHGTAFLSINGAPGLTILYAKKTDEISISLTAAQGDDKNTCAFRQHVLQHKWGKMPSLSCGRTSRSRLDCRESFSINASCSGLRRGCLCYTAALLRASSSAPSRLAGNVCKRPHHQPGSIR